MPLILFQVPRVVERNSRVTCPCLLLRLFRGSHSGPAFRFVSHKFASRAPLLGEIGSGLTVSREPSHGAPAFYAAFYSMLPIAS